jgi:hypothetical protein
MEKRANIRFGQAQVVIKRKEKVDSKVEKKKKRGKKQGRVRVGSRYATGTT